MHLLCPEKSLCHILTSDLAKDEVQLLELGLLVWVEVRDSCLGTEQLSNFEVATPE